MYFDRKDISNYLKLHPSYKILNQWSNVAFQYNSELFTIGMLKPSEFHIFYFRCTQSTRDYVTSRSISS